MSASSHVLNVTTADEVTEIAIYDGSMNVVTKGVGRMSESLPAGLYRIKIRVGASTDEKLTALDRDQTVTFDRVPFASAIPLDRTSKSHEYHMGDAVAASETVRKTFGAGASIMVLAREWSVEGNRSSGNPAQGLSLLDANETLLSEIWTEAVTRNDPGLDASAGWRADVNPGAYFLRLELDDADKTALLRPIYVSPGHQLQIFCLVGDHVVDEDGTRKTIRRADIAAAAIVISMSGRFNPNDRLTRLSELACYSLAQSRPDVSPAFIGDLLADKYENPMLGLFGAHLMLREKPKDEPWKDAQLYRTVTDNLRNMLGPEHPDLQALWWQRDDSKTNPMGDGRLHVLPMLRASWSLAVDRSIKTFDVFSLGTFYDKLTRIVPSASWLMLVDNDWAVSDDAIADYIKARASSQVTRAEAKAALKRAAFLKRYATRAYSTLRGMLPASIASYLPDVDAAPAAQGGSDAPVLESTTALPLDNEDRATLARTLALPAEVVDTILRKKGH